MRSLAVFTANGNTGIDRTENEFLGGKIFGICYS